MQHLEVSGAVRSLYGSLGVKGLKSLPSTKLIYMPLAARRKTFMAPLKITNPKYENL
jgi:hypothetical protein